MVELATPTVRLEKIRDLPQKTEKQRLRKKEQTRLFRMETLLGNAACAQFFTQTLEKDPTQSIEEFRKKAKSGPTTLYPAAVDNFIISLTNARNSARLIIEKYQRGQRGMRPESLPTDLFYSMQIQEGIGMHNPDGEIQLIDTYPLALIMGLPNKDDFNLIDPRNNIAGFFRQDAPYMKKDPGEKDDTEAPTYPLIVINGSIKPKTDPPYESGYMHGDFYSARRDTVAHEKNHAEHKVFIDTIKKSGKKLVWARLDDIGKLMEGTVRLINNWDASPELARLSGDYSNLLDHVLSQAKNELLAEINNETTRDNRSIGELRAHLTSLKKRGGVYDYFSKIGGIEGSLYEHLWSKYENILDAATAQAAATLEVYERFMLIGRAKLFRWVLAQIPIDQWEKRLQDSLFVQEAQALSETYEDLPFKEQKISHPWFEAGEKDLQYANHVNDTYYFPQNQARADLINMCNKRPEKSFFPYIKKYRAKIKKLIAARETDPIVKGNATPL